jgi:hypothetical protein
MNLSFSENEKEKLERLLEAYKQAKSLVIYAEEVDPESRSNLQVVKELRDAFDHLMKVLIAKKEPRQAKPEVLERECLENLEKSIGHVYRASFDALDGTVLSLKELIAEELSSYPLDAVVQVFPDYFDIKIQLHKLIEQVSVHRANKDVSESTNSLLDAYVADVARTKVIHEKILHAGPAIEEASRESKKKAHREQTSQLKIKILGGVVVALIIWVVTLLYNSYTSHSPQATPHADSTQSSPNK